MSAASTAARVVATVELHYLPPTSLSKNGRAHWRTKATDFLMLKTNAGWQLREFVGTLTVPYTSLTMHIEWFQAGVMTDADAVLARLSAVMDAAEAVRLVDDDAHIEIGSIRRIKVKHRAEQRVIVQFVEGEVA